eukprot:scaffold71837_cov43-Phaeocystis_antarctica.AAC.1
MSERLQPHVKEAATLCGLQAGRRRGRGSARRRKHRRPSPSRRGAPPPPAWGDKQVTVADSRVTWSPPPPAPRMLPAYLPTQEGVVRHSV